MILLKRMINLIFPRWSHKRDFARSIYYFVLKKTNRYKFIPFPESVLAHQYCVGKGIEIGAAAINSFGLDAININLDNYLNNIYTKVEKDSCGENAAIDIVADGAELPIKNSSQDFVINSHVIEHLHNPVKALLEWDRVVKTNGIIFMIIPHKDRNYDKHRSVTYLQHIMNDYHVNNTKSHNDPKGHDHVWDTQSFVFMIKFLIVYFNLKWKIEETQDSDDKIGNGFTVVLRKLGVRE
jgi:SAM-dependent methyltransferase